MTRTRLPPIWIWLWFNIFINVGIYLVFVLYIWWDRKVMCCTCWWHQLYKLICVDQHHLALSIAAKKELSYLEIRSNAIEPILMHNEWALRCDLLKFSNVIPLSPFLSALCCQSIYLQSNINPQKKSTNKPCTILKVHFHPILSICCIHVILVKVVILTF